MICSAVHRSDIHGPLNGWSPQPVRSRQSARVLGHTVGHRSWIAVPTPMVRMSLGAVTAIMVHGQRVLPTKAAGAGYRFRYPDLDRAVDDLLCADPHVRDKH